MKTIQRILGYILLCFGGLCACQKPGLEEALDAAGDNRKELEAVLEHYKDAPQKLQAARFLIENMDAHYFFEGEAVTAYYRYMDSVFRNCEGDRPYWNRQYDTILQRVGKDLETCMAEPRFDIEEIKAEYLIANIDSAFAVYHQNWNKQYGFDIFLRYVLPYRLGNEQVSDWRTELALPAGERKAYAENTFNTNYVYGIAQATLGIARSTIYYPRIPLPNFPLDMLRTVRVGTCREYAHLCVAALRAQGIPATVDFIPQWGNRSLGHAWCVFFSDNERFIPLELGEPLGCAFMKRKGDRIPKVFRNTFEKRSESLAMQNAGREPIPTLFEKPCLEDVTDKYVETANVEVDLYDEDYGTRYVYLAVFNNRTWSIVHWGRKQGRKASFEKMGVDIVYLPVYFVNGQTVPAGDAFLLDSEGRKQTITPDFSRKTSVTVKRKFRDIRSNEFLQGVRNGKFQLANHEDFRDSLTVYTIPCLEDNQFHRVFLNGKKRYRYFRYVSPDGSRGNMAELYAFDENGDTLKAKRFIGNRHTRPFCGIENIADGNALSYFESHDLYNVWYGWEFERPSTVSQILYLPRNDDNFIREGEEYMLLYWNRNRWNPVGVKMGNFESRLVFDNAPSGALFRLHNRTKGMEERIFTYEDGQPTWR